MQGRLHTLTSRYTIIQIRLNDTKHGEMYQEDCSLAHSVDVNSSKPRICGCQQHRSNAHDSEDTVEGTIGLTSQFHFWTICCLSLKTGNQ